MKGLLDSQICSVEDQVEPRYLLSPPTGQDFGAAFRPQGSTRYSANINKQLPAVGVGRSDGRGSQQLLYTNYSGVTVYCGHCTISCFLALSSVTLMTIGTNRIFGSYLVFFSLFPSNIA